ncbi:hypothetical protein K9M47_04260 [Candidatus Gracilibacteria bacterium]|nr:hypothetical protein [Candidatus Gracilibacteria bacterium]
MNRGSFSNGICTSCGQKHDSQICPNQSGDIVARGGVTDAVKQMNAMSEIVGPEENNKICLCGRTSSTGCFRPRCDFPGFHG